VYSAPLNPCVDGSVLLWGLSAPEPGCLLSLARVVPFVPFIAGLKLSLEVVLIVLLFADSLRRPRNDSNLEGR